MMTPQQSTLEIEDQDEQQNQMSALKRAIDARFKALENLINRQMIKDLQSISNENRTRFNTLEKDLKLRFSSLQSQIKDQGKRSKDMEDLAKESRDFNKI